MAIVANGDHNNVSTVYIATLILTGDPTVPAFRAEDGRVT